MKKMLLLLVTMWLTLLAACTQPCTEHSYGDWIAEESDYYRICEVCKEKELHTHTYGDWNFGLKDMSHSCVECGNTETLDIDPELAIKTCLPGHWSFNKIRGLTTVYAHELDETDIGYYLNIHEDGSATCWNMEELFRCTWALKEYDPESGFYIFTLDFLDGAKNTFLFDLANQTVVFSVGEDTCYLTQNLNLLPYVVGTYAAVDESGLHQFTLEEDHTIAGHPDSSWQITPIYTKTFLYQDKPAHSYHFDLKLVLQQKGKPVVHKRTINLCSNDYDLTPEEIEARNNEILYKIGFHFDIGDGKRLYQHTSAEELAILKAAHKDYTDLLTGTWTSTTVSEMGSIDGDPCTEYTVTFTADKKFEGNFGQTLSGTWKLDSASSLDDSSYFSIDMKCSNGSMLYGLLDPTSESLVIVNDGTNISFALK